MANPPLSWTRRINASVVVPVTPTITAGAYSNGLQIGGIMTLPNVVRQDSTVGSGFTELVEVTILDRSKQDSAIDIWFFNQSPTLSSTDHTSFNMTAANFMLQCIGVVALGTVYSDAPLVTCSVSSNTSLNKCFQIPYTAANPNNLYAVAISRGTPTYTTTTALQFQFGFFLD